tara:strand:+ start:6773 stop:7558 length:786 start_codon:yes stop_codon:yes gene_type:complete
LQDLNLLQSSESSDEGSQAWAIPFADMMTLLLTLFILLLVILKESEKFVDRQINLLLQETYEQLDEKIENENVSIERVTKGIQITLRGNLFQSMKANVNRNYIPIIQEISKIIEGCRLFNVEESKQYSSLISFLDESNQELNVEIRCEGHTDDAILPTQSVYRNNWELSSARSLRVVSIMNEASSISEKYFSYNGYGEFRPLINVSRIDDFQKKKQARAYNRRVEIYLDAFARPKTRSSEDEFLKMMDDKFKKPEVISTRN